MEYATLSARLALVLLSAATYGLPSGKYAQGADEIGQNRGLLATSRRKVRLDGLVR